MLDKKDDHADALASAGADNCAANRIWPPALKKCLRSAAEENVTVNSCVIVPFQVVLRVLVANADVVPSAGSMLNLFVPVMLLVIDSYCAYTLSKMSVSALIDVSVGIAPF
jgi:hypothetical protein